MKKDNRYLRFISHVVRFGCGYRIESDRKQYFAFHGSPRGNEDYYTTTEISEEEYEQIAREYPDPIDADVETAEVFRRKYVRGHSVLLEGWDELL